MRDADGRLTHIGGEHPEGTRWTIPLEQAIAEVEAGIAVFFVSLFGQHLAVTVDRSAGTAQLATALDGGRAVAGLPECGKDPS